MPPTCPPSWTLKVHTTSHACMPPDGPIASAAVGASAFLRLTYPCGLLLRRHCGAVGAPLHAAAAPLPGRECLGQGVALHLQHHGALRWQCMLLSQPALLP